MNKKTVNRAVSLTIALEMFLSPLAMARADTPDGASAGPAAVTSERLERPGDLAGETPAVDDGAAQTSGEDASETQAGAAQTGSAGGVSDAGSAGDAQTAELLANSYDYAADISFGIDMNQYDTYPARYNGFYKWEGGTDRTWGYRAYGSTNKFFVYENNTYYISLPNPGRLPDLKLDGFYIPQEAPARWYDPDRDDSYIDYVKAWRYDETWTSAVRLKETEDAVTLVPDDYLDVDYYDKIIRKKDAAITAIVELPEATLEELEGKGIIQGGVDSNGISWIGHVPMVARWLPSDRAQITALSATIGTDTAVNALYTQDPSAVDVPETLTLADITADTFADTEEKEFWLRVAEDQESLTLQFATYEPYYDYHVNGGDCPVQVTAVFNGADVSRADGTEVTVTQGWTWDDTGAATDAMVPTPGKDTSGNDEPRNADTNPARAHWTVADIPLAKVADAADLDDPYTTVTITVTAPDGDTKAQYILHVERLMTPTYALGLGNTPVAMIEKDQKGNWGDTEEAIRANKDAAKEDFAAYYTLGNTGVAAPGDYAYYKGQFDPLAWRNLVWEGSAKGYNIDLDETAVVAYQDTAFADPGVSFVGSDGRQVVFGDTASGDYKTCVTRTIQLRVADKLTVGLYGDSGAGTTCWYNPDADNRLADKDEASPALHNADGSDGVDLRGLNVLPGVYTMTYTFTDPRDKDDPVVVKRPLVVLPIPGDVDMDGAVTVADALALTANQSAWESSTAADVQLLRYRVLGGVDAADILDGFQPVLANLGRSDYFYPPLDAPADAGSYARKTWDEVTMDGSATLSLRYLGLERGILQGEAGYTTPATDGVIDLTNGVMGPWQANADGTVTLGEVDTNGNYKYGYYQTDTFWVGVYLTAGELAGSTVEDLTLSLTYDSDYVQPAVVYQYNQFADAENQEERWYRAFFYYNFGDGSTADGAEQTLFSGKTTSDYTYRSGTTWSRAYATHYSKVIGELETVQSDQSSLREMVFSIQGKASGSRVTLPEDEVCVLVVPFQLIHHPVGDRLEDDTARLVELGAGMRDFNLVTQAPAGSAYGVSTAERFSRLLATLSQTESQTESAGDVTYAFSAQDSIYGGATQNLREKVQYESTAGRIPIGENKTATSVLKEANYAEFYEVKVQNGDFSGTLPEGLEYKTVLIDAYITGTPTESGGPYRFTVTVNGREYYYSLTVNKRTIHFRPVGCGSYYGQPEYRGKASANFTFTYNTEDIAQRDVPENVTLTGDGGELKDILGEDYVPVTFTAKASRDDTADVVTANTGIGLYPIVLDGGTGLDDNYELVLDETDLDAQTLQIFPRPVWIDYLTADADATGARIYSDGDSGNLNQTIALTETNSDTPMIHLALREDSFIDGQFGGRPLTGDARVAGDLLTLTFNGTFQRNAADEAYSDNKTTFYMTAGTETRAIGNVTISENQKNLFDQANPNYTLQLADGGVLNAEKNAILGTVIRREITELRMTDYPISMREGGSVTYGQRVSLADLRICILRDGDDPDSNVSYDYNGSMAQAMDIHYNWVTKEEMEEGLLEANLNTVTGSGCKVDEQGELVDIKPYKDTNSFLDMSLDGYYLCAIARKFESSDPSSDPDLGENGFVKCYSANPIHVERKEVTLTPKDMTRFYGEESAQPTYVYDVNALSTADLNRLHGEYGTLLTGDASELEWLLGEDYTKPAIQFMKTPSLPESESDENIVTADTDVTGTAYYIVLSGAASTNYTFRYARVDASASTEYGTAYLSILKRPIVAEDLGSMYGTAADGEQADFGYKNTFATIYADSKSLLLTDQVDGQTHTAFEASGDPNAANQVTFIAPDYDAGTRTVTYYSEGRSEVSQQKDMVYSGDPVRAGDLDKLGVTYNVQFLPDAGHYVWNSLSQNYYDVSDLEAEGGQGQRPVEIRDLQLTGDKAGNYMLVYNESFHATQRAPANAVYTKAPGPGIGADAAFLQYGTGLVILRPIESMDIKYVGCMEYTYGEYFAPDNPGISGKQLTLTVQYATRYDNFPKEYAGDTYHNVNSEEIPYTIEDGENTTFATRGFRIHYIDTATQSVEELAPDKQTLVGGDALYPAVHNGKHIFVSGRRGENDPLICSSITAEALTIHQAALTLTARDVHRYYGEANADGYVVQEVYDPEDNVKPFTFTFQASQLAVWDREKLGELLGAEIKTVDTLTQAQLETALETAAKSDDPDDRAWSAGFGYAAPTITTDATETSPINTKDGKWGEYDIHNTVTSFTNYAVTGVGATLYVYPRPIYITNVSNSQEDPVYTVYSETDGKLFNTSFSQDRVSVARINETVAGLSTWPRSLANSVVTAPLKLSGSALVGEDRLTYKAQVQYPDGTTLPEGVTDAYMDVVLTISATNGLASSAGEAEKNYVLTRSYEDPYAVGAVKLRTIGYILILDIPKAKYTYGDTLDLSGLKVRVVYMMLGDESAIAERVTVTYEDPNQFQSYGLYVNYWDTAYDTIPADLKSVPTAYRKAATGDHLTIAPTHDTQQYLGNDMSDPLRRPFSANGTGLIVSAFQSGDKQTAAQPKIVSALATPIEGTGMSSYEVTEDNPNPLKISVSPLRLTYTLSATDKTYNGDTKTAGTLRLTNLFDRDNVQTQTASNADGSVQDPVRASVTDVVYVPVGAAYESVSQADRYTSYIGTAYQVQNGAVSFTTGSYTRSSTGYLDKNDAVVWAQGYQWDKGLLEFSFPNANVHYVDDAFAGGLPGVGTEELAAYWRAGQDMNTADGRWDSFATVSQMPVEVRNMTFRGPDAANYTWDASTQPQTYETSLTLDSDPADLGSGQGSMPYATVYKANRQPIQELLADQGFVLPTLQVDAHTNVVRLLYGEELDKVADRTDPTTVSDYERPDGNVLNETGTEDYRDELHFEYALAYKDADGLLTQWAGRDGESGYQDTLFFGGEVFLPQIDPAYVPDLERLDQIEDADEDTVYKGQRYQWAQEDTGLSQRGYREDSGFYIDPSAYPGYATYGAAVRDAYWQFDLYNTDRTGLPRDTVYYPLVRLAETHNYNPSADLTGDGDGDGQSDVSAQALYEAQAAVGAYRQGWNSSQAEALKAEALAKSQAVFAAGEDMDKAAKKQAQDEVDRDAALSENSFPETKPDQPAPISAVKTYRQRLDILSASWERSADGDGEEFLVKLVEDIKFTDTHLYPEQKLMDAVVWNDPVRYYGYAWDPDMSAQLRFGDTENPIDLDTEMTFAIRQRQPDGNVLETTWTYYPEASNHTVQLYVQLTSGGGQTVRSIKIVPSILFARVGDKPIQLGLVTDPKMPTNRRYTWTSSDPSVATVSASGLVTIRGEGTCIITVTTTNRKSDSITVVVSSVLPMGSATNPIFNFYYTGPWAVLDSDYAFRPKDTMTRGDVVQLLDLLINPEYGWTATREIAYVDVTGKERYYGALVRLTRVGVVEGVPGSAFAGERLATRAEFVTMLARMLELSVPDTVGMAHAFVDSGEDATWAYAYIDAVAKAGVVQGTGGGYFAPSRNITREEAAAIIARLVVNQTDRDHMTVPSDMTPENWSYPAVLRAINSVAFPET